MIAVRLNQLSKKYGRRIGISGIDLTIEEGEIFGLIGPDGAGKTTILRILMNYVLPSDGEAEIFDMDVTDEAKKIKKETAYVPGEVYFYHKKRAGKFINLTLKAHHQKKNPLKKELVNRFELDLRERFEDMDRSDQKKMALIAAILAKPRLLLLDEPLRGLDALAQSDLFQYLTALRDEGTTILITGRDSEEIADICDRMAVIENGEITVAPEEFVAEDIEFSGGEELAAEIAEEPLLDEKAAAQAAAEAAAAAAAAADAAKHAAQQSESADEVATESEATDSDFDDDIAPAEEPKGDGWDDAATIATPAGVTMKSIGFDRAAFENIGARVVSETDDKVVLEYAGDINDLAKFLYDMEMDDIQINDAGLEEAFRPFYAGGEDQ